MLTCSFLGVEGHTFCHACWCQWLERKRSCPTCRSSIDEATPLIKNRIAERMVGELRSHCPFRPAERPEKRRRIVRDDEETLSEVESDYGVLETISAEAAADESVVVVEDSLPGGCAWTGNLRDLEDHMDTCEFALSPCTVSPLCSKKLAKKLIKDHEAQCPYLRTLCGRCGRLVRVAALKHHQKSNKCHRAQSLLLEYLNLVVHTARCVAAEGQHDEAPTSFDDQDQRGSPFQQRPPPQSTRRCQRRDCLKMAALLRHYAKCSSRDDGNCSSGICNHLTVLLQLHARDCSILDCQVPSCDRWLHYTDDPFANTPELQSAPNLLGGLATTDPNDLTPLS